MELYDKALRQFPVEYESLVIPTRFGNVHALVVGDANMPPLFLIHGAASNATSWLPNIEQLSQYFRVFMLDIPGDGGKSVAMRVSRSGQEYVDWLVDVMDKLKLEKVDCVGLSLGGYISLLMVLRQPERINRVILIAPAIFLPMRLNFVLHAFMAGVFTTHTTVNNFLRYITAPSSPFDPYLSEFLYLILKHLKPGNSIPAALRREDLARITNPVMFLVGQYEVLYNPNKAIEKAKAVFPNVETRLIPDAGHITTWEQPALVNQLILDFLAVNHSETGTLSHRA